MNPKRIAIALLVVTVAGRWSPSAASETTVQRSDLPAAVDATLTSRYPDAQVLRLIREKVKGVVVYEAEMTIEGVRVDALIAPDGTLREEERAIAEADVPEAVRAAHARSAHARWKVEGRERLTTGDAQAPPQFELILSQGKKRVALVYAEDGRLVKTTPLTASPRPPAKQKAKATPAG